MVPRYVFFSFFFFCWEFLFFKYVLSVIVIAYKNIFMMIALKFLLDNFYICVVLLLASVNCLFLSKFRLSWFSAWWLIFLLYPGHLEYYAMKSGYYWNLDVLEIFYFSRQFDTKLTGEGRSFLLPTGGDRCLGSPLGLHWYNRVIPWVPRFLACLSSSCYVSMSSYVCFLYNVQEF